MAYRLQTRAGAAVVALAVRKVLHRLPLKSGRAYPDDPFAAVLAEDVVGRRKRGRGGEERRGKRQGEGEGPRGEEGGGGRGGGGGGGEGGGKTGGTRTPRKETSASDWRPSSLPLCSYGHGRHFGWSRRRRGGRQGGRKNGSGDGCRGGLGGGEGGEGGEGGDGKGGVKIAAHAARVAREREAPPILPIRATARGGTTRPRTQRSRTRRTLLSARRERREGGRGRRGTRRRGGAEHSVWSEGVARRGNGRRRRVREGVKMYDWRLLHPQQAILGRTPTPYNRK